MASTQDLVKDYWKKLSSEKKPIANLRELHQKLTQQLGSSIDSDDRMCGLFYKAMIEDVLENCIEDDYLDLATSKKIISRFISALRESDKSWEKRLAAFKPFAEIYKDVETARKIPDFIYLADDKIKALIATRKGNPFNIGDEHDFDVFPSLDLNSCNPETSKLITKLYLNQIMLAREDFRQAHEEINWLCFIEKSYSVIGAIALLSSLVSQTELPACIYRPRYWNPQAKISGKAPLPNSRVCAVYDMVLGGSAILDAAEFLKNTYDAYMVAVVVLFDYDLKDRTNQLKEKGREILGNKDGIRLYPAIKLSQVKDQVEKSLSLFTALNECGKNVEDLDKRVALISHLVAKASSVR